MRARAIRDKTRNTIIPISPRKANRDTDCDSDTGMLSAYNSGRTAVQPLQGCNSRETSSFPGFAPWALLCGPFRVTAGDHGLPAWSRPNRRGSDRKATPKGRNRKARGENPGIEAQPQASTLKGLNSLCAADTDCPARPSSGCQRLNHSDCPRCDDQKAECEHHDLHAYEMVLL